MDIDPAVPASGAVAVAIVMVSEGAVQVAKSGQHAKRKEHFSMHATSASK
ncbi:hypothetical protein [Azospirillum doebereinerae]|nr:hypothetical protein [Azospirillum doebereinerae]